MLCHLKAAFFRRAGRAPGRNSLRKSAQKHPKIPFFSRRLRRRIFFCIQTFASSGRLLLGGRDFGPPFLEPLEPFYAAFGVARPLAEPWRRLLSRRGSGPEAGKPASGTPLPTASTAASVDPHRAGVRRGNFFLRGRPWALFGALLARFWGPLSLFRRKTADFTLPAGNSGADLGARIRPFGHPPAPRRRP